MADNKKEDEKMKKRTKRFAAAAAAVQMAVLTSISAFPSYASNGYEKSATYYSDDWVINFWNSESSRMDEELAQIAADGFNSIILVVPWNEFQPDMNPCRYEEYPMEKFHKVMNAAGQHGLDVYLRVGYTLSLIHILLGASDMTIEYADSYLTIYLLGSTFVMIGLGMNSFINSQGFGKIGMMTVLLGAVANLILDPVFIFVFHMGVQGAALATIISQGLSALWIIRFLTGKKTILRLKKSSFVLEDVYKRQSVRAAEISKIFPWKVYSRIGNRV